jgi:DNA polymerase I-like protein with 3'-5' exonuclease and polymerase domains
MTLLIWTGADASTIRKVMGPIIGRQPIPHEVIPFPQNKFDPFAIPQCAPGDVLLACGARAMEALCQAGIFPKKRTIGSCRENPVKHGDGHLFVTYDPGMINIDYARFPEIQWDTALAIRQHNLGDVRPKIGKYTWVESLHEVIAEIDRRYEATGKPVYMACDIEAMGLDEYREGARILSISFTIDEGESFMLYFEEGETLTPPEPWLDLEGMDYWQGLWTQVNWLLTTDKVRTEGANFKFDSRWLNYKWAINCTNLKFDTLLVGTLLNENISNSLKMHAKIHTDMGGYEDGMDKYDMGHLEVVPKEELGDYMGGDTDATHRVAKTMRKELVKDHRLVTFYTKLLHPSATVFEKMERNGIVVDVEYMAQLESEIEAEQFRLRKKMQDLCPRKLVAKYADNFSFTRPVIIKDLFFSSLGYNLKPKMYTEKAKEQTKEYASTSVDHLMMFGDAPEAAAFVSLLSELNSANKTQSTYVQGFMKHLRSDGRFHPHYMLFKGGYGDKDDDAGADTGRTSAKDPAVQTIPKHTKWQKKLRRAYIPPPGKTILQLDFSQGELKIAACLANEPTMINAYQNGIDLHAITAARISGYEFHDFMLLPEDVRDDLRSRGKAGNFGLLYGMGAEGFMNYAFTSYGVKMTLMECETARDAFFELYSALPQWHDYYKNIAKRFGEVRSPLGRVRHLPLINSRDRQAASKAGRNAINSPVQSTLSDMMQLAMVMIDREYGDQVEMFLMCHDSIAMYVPIEEAEIWAKRLKAVLDNLPLKQLFGWDHQLQFTSDAEVAVPDIKENLPKGLGDGATSLASLKKVKLLA